MPRTWRDALCFLLEVAVIDFTWRLWPCLCSASALFCGLLKGCGFALVVWVYTCQLGLCLFSSSGASLMLYPLTVNYWKVCVCGCLWLCNRLSQNLVLWSDLLISSLSWLFITLMTLDKLSSDNSWAKLGGPLPKVFITEVTSDRSGCWLGWSLNQSGGVAGSQLVVLFHVFCLLVCASCLLSSFPHHFLHCILAVLVSPVVLSAWDICGLLCHNDVLRLSPKCVWR